jgi:hypothetical protein
MEREVIENVDTELTETGTQLLEDGYLAWFRAETECEGALRAWFAQPGGDDLEAYLAYRAALDREESTALDLERFYAERATCPS